MIIKDNRGNKQTMFSDLSVGDIFKYSDYYFMKVTKDNYFNLSLCSYDIAKCSDFACTKLNASIVIED